MSYFVYTELFDHFDHFKMVAGIPTRESAWVRVYVLKWTQTQPMYEL